MAVIVLQEGPKNLNVLVNTGGGTLTVASLNPPCAGLSLREVRPTSDAVGTIAGPSTTVWALAAGSHPVCFDDFGGVSDGDGNWTLVQTAGISVLSFTKIDPTFPNPN